VQAPIWVTYIGALKVRAYGSEGGGICFCLGIALVQVQPVYDEEALVTLQLLVT